MINPKYIYAYSNDSLVRRYNIVTTKATGNIRRANLCDIAGTQSFIPDITSNSEIVYPNTLDDQLVSKLLFTTGTTNNSDQNIAYLLFDNGIMELLLVTKQCAYNNKSRLTDNNSDKFRITSLVITNSTPDDKESIVIDVTNQPLLSSPSSKIIRIITQGDTKLFNALTRSFNTPDFGYIEILDTFNQGINEPTSNLDKCEISKLDTSIKKW